MEKNFWRSVFQMKDKKVMNQIGLMILLGVVLILLGGSFYMKPSIGAKDNMNRTMVAEDVIPVNPIVSQTTEEKLEEILSNIEGAGAVKVMITYATTEEKIIAHNQISEKSYYENQQMEGENKNQQVVLLEQGNVQTPYILIENAPIVEGVVVVAEGGGSATVCQALHTAVQAMFEVDAHKIAVLKMK